MSGQEPIGALLRSLVDEHGDELLEDRRRLEGFLRDLRPHAHRQITVLIAALRERIPAELEKVSAADVDVATFRRCVQRLYDRAGIAEPFAREAVAAWAAAVGKRAPSDEVTPSGPAADAPAPPTFARQKKKKQSAPEPHPTPPSGTRRPAPVASGRYNELVGHRARVTSLAFSRDGQILASASDDGTLRLWSVSTGWELQALRPGVVGSMDFCSDADRIACASEGPILLLDTNNGTPLRYLKGHSGEVADVAFAPFGDRLASAGRDGTVRLWALDEDRISVRTIKPSRQGVGAVAFSPDGRFVATGDVGGHVRLYDVESGRARGQVGGHASAVNCLAFAQRADVLVSGSDDTTVVVWRWARSELVHELAGHTLPVMAVACHPDGAVVASVTWDRSIWLWDVATGQLMQQLSSGTVHAVRFSPDGRFLASAGGDGRIRLWEL